MSEPAPQSNVVSSWQDEIRARTEEARAAFQRADLAVLDQMWTDSFVVNSPLQRVLNKQQVLEALRTGRIRHLQSELEIEHVSRDGDIVTVMGRDRVVDPPDNSVSRRRFTDIWKLGQDGVWRMLARHAQIFARE